MSSSPSWTDVERLDIEGRSIAYRRVGAGEPVLLVHGVTTASFIWEKVARRLAGHYDVIAVDLLGVGASDRPADVDYSPASQAKIVHSLAIQLGLRKVHLVGHDVGGGIVQILAVRHPEMLVDLCVVNTVGYDFWPVQPIITLRTPIVRQLAMATLDLGVLRMIIRRGLFHKDRLTEELLEHFRQQVSADNARKSFLHFVKCLNNRQLMDLADDLRRLPMPVLIIRGDADAYLTEEISSKLHREIPGSRLVRIPTAGHFIQEDEPELLADTLVEFFSERSNA